MDRMLGILLQADRIRMFSGDRDIPGVWFRKRILTAAHADEARDLTWEVPQPSKHFVGVISVRQVEEDDVGKHLG